jgi:iron complex outermembrane recepter protein
LMKVQNIQVLKGPQGTLFGRNTTGGAILVTTAEPSETPGAQLKASYGNFNTVEVQGYGTAGLGQGLAFDVEGLYRRSDGFQTNIINGDKKVGGYERWSIRTGLKAELSENVSVLLRYVHLESDDPTALMHNAFVEKGVPFVQTFTPPSLYTTDPDKVAFTDRLYNRTKADIVQGTIKADLGFANLTSYTQYRDENVDNLQDLDATALNYFSINIVAKNRTFTQELLLSSKSGSRLQWTTGAYYFRNRDTWNTSAILGGGPLTYNGASSTVTESIAAFADATYEVTPQLFVTAGARYSHDKVKEAYFLRALTAGGYENANGTFVPYTTQPLYSQLNVPDLTNERVTPRVVVRYKPDERSSIYGSFSMGYKAGLLNVGGYSYKPVRPEKITAYELGYKYSDRRLSVDLSGFYYDYKDLQVSSFQAGTAKITNAASSEIYGLEGQVSYRMTSDFTLSGGAAWTHAKYKNFQQAPFYIYCGTTAGGPCGTSTINENLIDASGFQMQRSPKFTGNVAASYGLDLGGGRLNLSGNLYYTSGFFFGVAQQFRQKGYEQLSLRAEWVDPSEHFTVAVFGDNVTDRRYRAAVNYATTGIGSVWAQPATYGVQVGFKY